MLVLWDLCFCFRFCVSVVILDFCSRFRVSVVGFVFLFDLCVSVVSFCVSVLALVLVLWVLCFCFHFCVGVVGFVFLFSLLCWCCGNCVFVLFLSATVQPGSTRSVSNVEIKQLSKQRGCKLSNGKRLNWIVSSTE